MEGEKLYITKPEPIEEVRALLKQEMAKAGTTHVKDDDDEYLIAYFKEKYHV